MKNEMDGAYRKYGEERCHAGFSWGKVRERDRLDRASCRWDDNIKVNLKVGWK
jgi:hypothetical protein